MKEVTLKTLEQTDNVSLYSICFDGNALSEYESFVQKFKDDATLNNDYKNILLALEKIVAVGAFERFFRPEGKMNDRVTALSIDSRKLRLYCLRISDQILIVGNGGVKATRTYQQSDELSGYVMDLQQFDKLLKEAQKDGSITIEKNVITGIESKVFQLS
ncbi:MAG: hypothetical protein II037_02515 [Bacteroidales bacterium]|jgi:hypothetical protein|nr:hypothetical protein [Bacteroidales bacterium]MBQ1731060.1 hypothetical protein [Bacteroidales bacterium]